MAAPIRAAILGTGHGHDTGKLRVLRDSVDWEFDGVCEPDPALRTRRSADPDWGDTRWLSEEEILADPSIRVVAVEADVPRILEFGLRAVAAGKHLHLEKPPGTDLPAFRSLLASAREQGLIVQMGYMFRYNPGFNLVRELVSGGALGRIHLAEGCINVRHLPEKRRELDFHPGGMMLELGCHLIDMLVLLMGRPARVHPFLHRDGPEDDRLADNTLAVFEYDRALALIETSCLEPGAFPRRRFEVCGSRGTVVLQPLEPPAARVYLEEPWDRFDAGWQEVPLPDEPRYVRDLAELARCVRTGEPFPYAYEHDLAVQETVLCACGTI